MNHVNSRYFEPKTYSNIFSIIVLLLLLFSIISPSKIEDFSFQGLHHFLSFVSSSLKDYTWRIDFPKIENLTVDGLKNFKILQLFGPVLQFFWDTLMVPLSFLFSVIVNVFKILIILFGYAFVF